MKARMVATLLMSLICASHCARGVVVFSDDFSSNTTSQYTTSGTIPFTITNGVLQVTAQPGNGYVVLTSAVPLNVGGSISVDIGPRISPYLAQKFTVSTGSTPYTGTTFEIGRGSKGGFATNGYYLWDIAEGEHPPGRLAGTGVAVMLGVQRTSPSNFLAYYVDSSATNVICVYTNPAWQAVTQVFVGVTALTDTGSTTPTFDNLLVQGANSTNRVLDLVGTNAYASIPASAINNLSQYTFEATVRLRTNDDGTILCKQHDNVNSYAVWTLGWLGWDAAQPHVGGRLAYQAKNFSPRATTDVFLAAGEWYALAVTGNSTNCQLFINGRLVGSAAGDSSIPSDLSPTSTTIGAQIGNGWSGPHYLNGQVDEVRIWNRVLSNAEICSNAYRRVPPNTAGIVAYWDFDQSSASDSSTNGMNGSLSGVAGTFPTESPFERTLSIFGSSPVVGLSFLSVYGRQYTILGADSLMDTNWISVVSTNGSGDFLNVPDTSSATNSSRYYRLKESF